MTFKYLFAVGALLTAGACTHEHSSHGDPALAAQATVSLDQARATALQARPGDIREWELEREGGGSGLRYSFVIRSAGADYEVGVDARDGAVLENAAEGAQHD